MLPLLGLADSPSPAGEAEHPKPPAAVAVEYGLDPKLGALPTENLQFKTNTNYLLDQNRAAESRFQKLRGMGARTNYLEEFSRTVEAVLNSDASERIKEDTRKLTLLELAHQRELAAEKTNPAGTWSGLCSCWPNMSSGIHGTQRFRKSCCDRATCCDAST